MLRIYGPSHVNTKYFLEHEDRMVRVWNQAAKKFGIGLYRKNKYTGRGSFYNEYNGR